MHHEEGFDNRLTSKSSTITPTATLTFVRSHAHFHVPWLFRLGRPGVENVKRRSPPTAPGLRMRSAVTFAPYTPARRADRTRRQSRREILVWAPHHYGSLSSGPSTRSGIIPRNKMDQVADTSALSFLGRDHLYGHILHSLQTPPL